MSIDLGTPLRLQGPGRSPLTYACSYTSWTISQETSSMYDNCFVTQNRRLRLCKHVLFPMWNKLDRTNWDPASYVINFFSV